MPCPSSRPVCRADQLQTISLLLPLSDYYSMKRLYLFVSVVLLFWGAPTYSQVVTWKDAEMRYLSAGHAFTLLPVLRDGVSIIPTIRGFEDGEPMRFVIRAPVLIAKEILRISIRI